MGFALQELYDIDTKKSEKNRECIIKFFLFSRKTSNIIQFFFPDQDQDRNIYPNRSIRSEGDRLHYYLYIVYTCIHTYIGTVPNTYILLL